MLTPRPMRTSLLVPALLLCACIPDTDFVTVSPDTTPNAFGEPLTTMKSNDVDELLERAKPLAIHGAEGRSLSEALELRSVTTGTGASETPVFRIDGSNGPPTLQTWNGSGWTSGTQTFDYLSGPRAMSNGTVVGRMGEHMPLMTISGSTATYYGWYAPTTAEYRVVSTSVDLDSILPDRTSYRPIFDVNPGQAWASHCLWLFPWAEDAVDLDRPAYQICFQLPYLHDDVPDGQRGTPFAKARQVELKKSWWIF